MISAKRLVIAVIGVVLSTHVLSAQDFSMYRDFHVGMNLASVATQTAKNPSEAKVIHGKSSRTRTPESPRRRPDSSTNQPFVRNAR